MNEIIKNETDIMEMTKDDFYNIPFVSNLNKKITLFDSMVIVPVDRDEVHDSGFRHMFFTGVVKHTAMYNFSGFSDVLHMDGIGGYGLQGFNGIMSSINFAKSYHPWSIDCLPKSNLTRFFCPGFVIKIELPAVSSFSVYAVRLDRKGNVDENN